MKSITIGTSISINIAGGDAEKHDLEENEEEGTLVVYWWDLLVRGYLGSLFELDDVHVIGHVTEQAIL